MDKIFERLDSELKNLIGDTGAKVPGLGVIVYKDGREIFSAFHGRRNLEKNKPVTRDTRFRVASVSKMFTIFAIMKLVEEGKINLDEDAGKYLGFDLRNPNCPEKKITVRLAATHLSSIRDGKIYSAPPEYGLTEFFSPTGKFWEDGAHFDGVPGNFFCYCNLNYGILGTIIERVTGKRFDLYMKENIFSPLEIAAEYVPGNFSDTEFEKLGTLYRKKNPAGIWDESGKWYGTIDDYKNFRPAKNTLAIQNPYAENFQPVRDLKNYSPGVNATIFSPQGGLRISFEELAHVLEMLMNGGTWRGKKILRPESVAEMLKIRWRYDPEKKNGSDCGGAVLTYCTGFYFIDGKSSARLCKKYAVDLIGHAGQAFGMMSGLFFRPGTRDGFIYMMNGEALEEDTDAGSKGNFSANYVWEENIADPICRALIEFTD